MPCIGLQVFQGSPDINEPANFFINQLPSLGGRINLFLVLLITKECLRCSPVAVVIVYPRQKRAYPVSAVNHQYIAGCGRVPEDYAGNQITFGKALNELHDPAGVPCCRCALEIRLSHHSNKSIFKVAESNFCKFLLLRFALYRLGEKIFSQQKGIKICWGWHNF